MDSDSERKKRNTFLVELAVIAVVTLYLAFHVGYSWNLAVNADKSVDYQKFADVLQNTLFDPTKIFPLNLSIFIVVCFTGGVLALFVYNDYALSKNTLKGREHGSSSFNTDYRGMIHGYIMSPKLLEKRYWKKKALERVTEQRKQAVAKLCDSYRIETIAIIRMFLCRGRVDDWSGALFIPNEEDVKDVSALDEEDKTGITQEEADEYIKEYHEYIYNVSPIPKNAARPEMTDVIARERNRVVGSAVPAPDVQLSLPALSDKSKKIYATVPAPGGRKLCKKKRFSKEEVAFCKQQSQLYSKNVGLSLDTSLTQLNLNTIVFGGSGAGKSRFFVMPNLLQANSSYVVTDPSGELMSGTAKYLESRGYTIKCLNLENMSESCRYNPFAYVYEDSDLLIMVKALTENIEGPKKGGSGDNRFWDETSETLLVALCGYLFEVCNEENEFLYDYAVDEQGVELRDKEGKLIVNRNSDGTVKYKMQPKTDPNGIPIVFNGQQVMEKVPNPHWIGCRNFTNVLKLLNMADVSDNKQPGDKDDLDLLFDDLAKENPSSYAVSQYRVIQQAGTGKTAQNIVISTSAIFARFFMLDKITNLTYCDDMHLEELGQKPCALFIVTPQGDTTYNFLASMLYTQLFATLYHEGETNAKKRHTTSVKLDVPVRCLIDEAANIGVIPQFAEKLATMRKYGISACPIYQNFAQVKSIFKDNAETILGNCDTCLFLGGVDSSTVKMVSERLGKGTIYTDSSSTPNNWKQSGSQSRQKMGRELMTTTELEQMKNDHCVVFIRSMKPWYDFKYPLEKHPNYKYSGMCDSSNSFAGPWHLVLDRDLLKRIEVKKTSDRNYLKPMQNIGISDVILEGQVVSEKDAELITTKEEPAAESVRYAHRQLTPSVHFVHTHPQKTRMTETAKGISEPVSLEEYHRTHPGVRMKLNADPDEQMETYEEPNVFDDVLIQNLKAQPIGKLLLAMEKHENAPEPFVPKKELPIHRLPDNPIALAVARQKQMEEIEERRLERKKEEAASEEKNEDVPDKETVPEPQAESKPDTKISEEDNDQNDSSDAEDYEEPEPDFGELPEQGKKEDADNADDADEPEWLNGPDKEPEQTEEEKPETDEELEDKTEQPDKPENTEQPESPEKPSEDIPPNLKETESVRYAHRQLMPSVERHTHPQKTRMTDTDENRDDSREQPKPDVLFDEPKRPVFKPESSDIDSIMSNLFDTENDESDGLEDEISEKADAPDNLKNGADKEPDETKEPDLSGIPDDPPKYPSMKESTDDGFSPDEGAEQGIKAEDEQSDQPEEEKLKSDSEDDDDYEFMDILGTW